MLRASRHQQAKQLTVVVALALGIALTATGCTRFAPSDPREGVLFLTRDASGSLVVVLPPSCQYAGPITFEARGIPKADERDSKTYWRATFTTKPIPTRVVIGDTGDPDPRSFGLTDLDESSTIDVAAWLTHTGPQWSNEFDLAHVTQSLNGGTIRPGEVDAAGLSSPDNCPG